jgi:hypothetical protein
LLTESTATKNTSSTLCGAEVRDATSTPILVGLIGGAIAFLIFVGRICSSLPSSGRQLGWDDWTITIATALMIPPTVFAVFLSQNGLGKDIWTLPMDHIKNVLFVGFCSEDPLRELR